MMDWSLCIATLNRQDALLQTISCAKDQTRPPAQIVVIDVSENWEESRDKVSDMLAGLDIALVYETLDMRSLTVQRNVGISKCTSDIVFLLDDDSFTFPDCAERVMEIYEADLNHEIACISAHLVPDLPPSVEIDATPEQYHTAHSANLKKGQLKYTLHKSRLGSWFIRKVLMHTKDENFVRYEGDRNRSVPDAARGFDVYPLNYMPGSAMTVRKAVALAEPFDTCLRYYAAGEDADATYRFGRHGAILRANKAMLHHFKAAGGRVDRTSVIAMGILNMGLFVKRNCDNPDQFKSEFQRVIRRRFFAEILKDLASRRFSFPQVRGVVMVMRNWKDMWAKTSEELEDWYPTFQKDIIAKGSKR